MEKEQLLNLINNEKDIIISDDFKLFSLLNYAYFVQDFNVFNEEYVELINNNFPFPFIHKKSYELFLTLVPELKNRINYKNFFLTLDSYISNLYPTHNSIYDIQNFFDNYLISTDNLTQHILISQEPKSCTFSNIPLNIKSCELFLLSNISNEIKHELCVQLLSDFGETYKYNKKMFKVELLRLSRFANYLPDNIFESIINSLECDFLENSYIPVLFNNVSYYKQKIIYNSYFIKKYLEQTKLSITDGLQKLFLVDLTNPIEIKKFTRLKQDKNSIQEYLQDILGPNYHQVDNLESFFTPLLPKEQTEMFEWISDENISKINIGRSETAEYLDKLIKKIKENKVKPKIKLNNDKIQLLNNLKIEMPNFSDVIDFFIGQLKLNQLNQQKFNFKPILLLGDPGLGKTYLAKQLSTILNTGFDFIDFASTSAAFVIKGGSSQWKDSKEGKILKTLISSNTINPIILFDEIEKNISSNKNYPPEMVLYQLFESNNSINFEDEFIDSKFDASSIIFICTANDQTFLPKPLQDRMEIFKINKLNKKQTRELAKTMYLKTIKNYQLFEETLTEKVLEQLEDKTPREIDIFLNKMIAHSISHIDIDKIDSSKKIQIIPLDKVEKTKKTLGF